MSPQKTKDVQKEQKNEETTNENDINVVWCMHTTLSCVDSIYLIWQQTQNCLTAACCQSFLFSIRFVRLLTFHLVAARRRVCIFWL